MKLERCANGHFYDAERFPSCPFCNQDAGGTGTVLVDDNGNTLPNDMGGFGPTIPIDDFSKTDFLTNKTTDGGKTIGFFDDKAVGTEPVVGWLVCIGGSHLGEDFKLKAGRNFIGRSTSMDVALTADQSVSREKHCAVLYEPRNNIFIVQPGDARELSYLNDRVILNAVEIKAYDKLTLGKSTLLFVPFCGPQFMWETEEDKKEK